jgi:GEVED domain/SdrD B-like domain
MKSLFKNLKAIAQPTHKTGFSIHKTTQQPNRSTQCDRWLQEVQKLYVSGCKKQSPTRYFVKPSKKQLLFSSLLVPFLLLSPLFTPNARAVSIQMDGTRTVVSGTDCGIATYRFGTTSTFNGKQLDLLVEVLSEDNDYRGGQCLYLNTNVLTADIRDEDAGDDFAYMDLKITVVEKGTTTPVPVDRLTITGFDLDANGPTSGPTGTSTDDIYMKLPDGVYVSTGSLVQSSEGSFFGGQYQAKLKGRSDGNCNDGPGASVDITCRGGTIYINGGSGPNTVSTATVRLQNDNAYGDPTSNAASVRRFQLSFEVSEFDELVTNNTDYGDTPNSYGSTGHSVGSNIALGYGLVPDNEAAHQPSTNADSDDNDGANSAIKYDDEEGVKYNSQVLNGQTLPSSSTSNLDITTFGTGYLSGWIDLNRDGDFNDAGEKVISDRNIISNTVSTSSIPITIPNTASGGTSYMRFRFTTTTGVAASGYSASDGEVEDYQVTIASAPVTTTISGTLYEDSDRGDDLDASEPKLPANITVKLLDNSNNVIKTTTTDANGAYTFTGVTNGNYKIQVDTTDTDIPAGLTLGTPNDLAVTVSGSAITGKDFGFDEPATGNICISPSIATLPSAFNSSNYTKNIPLQGLVPLSFYDGSMQVSASLSGTATWTNGVQVQTGNLGSFTGDYLYLQPANASNYLASNNEATYVLSFPSGIPNFSMIGAGLNNNDGTTIIASYKGVPIQITAANFSQLSSGMTLKDADSDGQSDTVVSSNTTGGTNVNTNTYKLTIPVPVDRITVVSGKDESGNNGTVTIGLHTFQYCYEGGAVSGTLYEDSDRGDDLDASEPKLPKDIKVILYKDNNSNNTIDAGEEVANTLTNIQGQYTFNNVAAGTYKVKVDTTDTDIPSSYTLGTPNDLAVTVSGSTITGKDFGFDIPSNPNVLLIKRITKVNNSTTTKNGDNLAGYIDEVTNLYDDNTLDNPVSPAKPDTNKWVDADNDGKPDLIGGINGGNVRPGDEIEYTIYYLSAGDTTANNVLICDRVPDNATFMPTAFNSFPTKNTTGLPGSDRGIIWQNNGAIESLTNTSDGDTAEYLSPGVDPTIKYPGIKCDGSNTNGAVVVKLGNVPNATTPGTPVNSYGFIRFQGRVK